MLKRNTLILVVLAIIVLTCGVSGAAEKPWKLGHTRPAGSPVDIALHKFADTVKARTNGRISIEVYPASQLGDYTTVQERVSIGDVEMQCAGMSTAIVKEAGLTGTPYLVLNWKEAKKAFGPGGMVVAKVSEYLKRQDLHVFGTWPVYFGGILLTTNPVKPKDLLAAKGIKIRVPTVRSYELTATSLGYLATPLPWADTFTALQTGIVNGVLGGGAEGYMASFKDLAKAYLALNDHFECWYFYTNMDKWNKLSDVDKKVITDAANEMTMKRWEVAEKEEQEYLKKLEKSGIKVIYFTDKELAAYRDKIKKDTWPKLYDEIPQKDIEEVLASLSK